MKVLYDALGSAVPNDPLSKNSSAELRAYFNNKNVECQVVDNAVDFRAALSDVTVIITQAWTGTFIDQAVLDAASKLELIIVAGPAQHHIDADAVRDNNVTLAKIAYTSQNSYAEQQLYYILKITREQRLDLKHQRIGLIGLGKVATRLVELLKPFGMKINYYDPHQWEPSEEAEYNLTWFHSAEKVVEDCDIVVSNCPLEINGIYDGGTQNLFDKQLLAQMKFGATLLLASPKQTYNLQDVMVARDAGVIKCVTTDELTWPNLTYQAEILQHIELIFDQWLKDKSLPLEWLLIDKGLFTTPPDCECFALGGWHQ
jgi:phosphoglycerate dehydrogenase-like enzyme